MHRRLLAAAVFLSCLASVAASDAVAKRQSKAVPHFMVMSSS